MAAIAWLTLKNVQVLGAIEAGGTKFICGVGTGPDDLQTVRIPTTTPDETIRRCIDFFAPFGSRLISLGIGSFGPVDLKLGSATWGHITATPKAGWQNTSLADRFSGALGVPVGFDTDVNAAALAEARWGSARDVSSCVYLTVGTGIGGGAVFRGQSLRGMVHPEMGHVRIPRDSADAFPGHCPFHGDCFEGLAAGPAIEARWGKRPEELPCDHPAWALEAHYVALAVANFVLTLSPERVILGGGVMQRQFLFPLIQEELLTILNGYIQAPQVVPPGLGDRSGVLGGIALAEEVAVYARASNSSSAEDTASGFSRGMK